MLLAVLSVNTNSVYAGGTVSLDLRNIDISSLISIIYGDVLRQNFVIDSSVLQKQDVLSVSLVQDFPIGSLHQYMTSLLIRYDIEVVSSLEGFSFFSGKAYSSKITIGPLAGQEIFVNGFMQIGEKILSSIYLRVDTIEPRSLRLSELRSFGYDVHFHSACANEIFYRGVQLMTATCFRHPADERRGERVEKGNDRQRRSESLPASNQQDSKSSQ